MLSTTTIGEGIAPAETASEARPLRVLCVHEERPGGIAGDFRTDDGVPVHVDVVSLDALPWYLDTMGDAPLAAVLAFGDRAHAAPAAVRVVRSRAAFERARLYLFLPCTEPPEWFREEDDDVEDVLDRNAADPAELKHHVLNGVRAFRALGTNPLLSRYYLDAKHNDVFSWFEASRWHWKDAPDMNDIRRDLLSDEEIAVVKHACIAEFGTLPGAHNFLREWFDDCSFSAWAVVWGGEEARHSLLFARYLRAIGVEVMTKHAMYKREPYPVGPTRGSTLMMNMISESRAAEYYRCLGEAAREPVLKQILSLLSRDESRHASAFFQFCRELCEFDPKNLVPVLEMAYVWLADRAQGVKHPSGHFYPHSPSTRGFHQLENYLMRTSATVTDDADARVLAMIRKLTHDDGIQSPRDVKSWLRQRL
jgi:rubrerythrin